MTIQKRGKRTTLSAGKLEKPAAAGRLMASSSRAAQNISRTTLCRSNHPMAATRDTAPRPCPPTPPVKSYGSASPYPSCPYADVDRRHRLRSESPGSATSELQSRGHLVCRLLLEKKKRRH